jgi:hypothetical protein
MNMYITADMELSYTEHQFMFRNVLKIWISANTASSQAAGFVDNTLTPLQSNEQVDCWALHVHDVLNLASTDSTGSLY